MQPGAPGRPGHAAQPEQRHPPDIGAQPQPPGDPGIQRRHRQSGDRGGDQHVEILGSQTGLVECPRQGLHAQVHGFFDENLVRLAEVGQLRVFLQRQDQVAAVDFGAGVQLANDVFVALEIRDADKRVGELAL
ncbi:Uncharacterised protein [Mycobacterium tuberculosis]|nr:Uncharacterised protein [Mycobacterium tuberculosis]COW01277.1 Uncharacterised protein [Mycobacterium tuberculosis]